MYIIKCFIIVNEIKTLCAVFILGVGILTIFPYKLMAIASSLYIILVYEIFYRDTIFGEWGKPVYF